MPRKDKEVSRVLDEAKRLGYAIARTSNGHYRFTMPGVETQFWSGTPSDVRSVRNGEAKLRRAAKAGANNTQTMYA
jgi:hypothetical protein